MAADRAVLAGDRPELLAELAALDDVDVVLNGVVGFAGLPATLAALEHGKRLALANKESLIAGGPVVAAGPGGGRRRDRAGRLRALGALPGAPLGRAPRGLEARPHRERRAVPRAHAAPSSQPVTVADALNHPTWSMGPKITVDSSTLMNKGLEVIEAQELFGVGYDRVDVVVHPQSIVHGMVEFTDGATIAQLSMPDMRLPIGLALGAPDRLDEPFGALDWSTIGQLTFEPPDLEAFPCLALAYAAGRAGGAAPAVLNGANEVAVAAFLDGAIPWTAIPEVVDAALQEGVGNVDDVAGVLEADRMARERAEKSIANRTDGVNRTEGVG